MGVYAGCVQGNIDDLASTRLFEGVHLFGVGADPIDEAMSLIDLEIFFKAKRIPRCHRGGNKRAAKSREHAHHIIPRSLEDLFNQKISDPNLSIWDASLGAWWDSGAGYSAVHRQYTAEVQAFLLGFGDGQLSTADLMDYVAELRKKYGF